MADSALMQDLVGRWGTTMKTLVPLAIGLSECCGTALRPRGTVQTVDEGAGRETLAGQRLDDTAVS
jgi:hypothetical protein